MYEKYHIEPEIKSKISEYSGVCVIESMTIDLVPINYHFIINDEYKNEINWGIENILIDKLAKQIIDDLIPLGITHEVYPGKDTIYSLDILQEKERVTFIREIERLKKRKEEVFREKLKVDNENDELRSTRSI